MKCTASVYIHGIYVCSTVHIITSFVNLFPAGGHQRISRYLRRISRYLTVEGYRHPNEILTEWTAEIRFLEESDQLTETETLYEDDMLSCLLRALNIRCCVLFPVHAKSSKHTVCYTVAFICRGRIWLWDKMRFNFLCKNFPLLEKFILSFGPTFLASTLSASLEFLVEMLKCILAFHNQNLCQEIVNVKMMKWMLRWWNEFLE